MERVQLRKLCFLFRQVASQQKPRVHSLQCWLIWQECALQRPGQRSLAKTCSPCGILRVMCLSFSVFFSLPGGFQLNSAPFPIHSAAAVCCCFFIFCSLKFFLWGYESSYADVIGRDWKRFVHLIWSCMSGKRFWGTWFCTRPDEDRGSLVILKSLLDAAISLEYVQIGLCVYAVLDTERGYAFEGFLGKLAIACLRSQIGLFWKPWLRNIDGFVPGWLVAASRSIWPCHERLERLGWLGWSKRRHWNIT